MRSLLILSLFASTLFCQGQNFSKYLSLRMETADDYRKHSLKALECANYLLEHPADEAEDTRTNAVAFVMRWMTGTADYTFEIGPELSELTGDKAELLGVYLAALTQAALKQQLKDPKEINAAAKEIYLNYCADDDNDVRPPRAVRKMISNRK